MVFEYQVISEIAGTVKADVVCVTDWMWKRGAKNLPLVV